MARGNPEALRKWREYARPFVEKYGPFEGNRRAKEARGHEHRMNPSLGGGKLVKFGIVGAVVYGGYKLFEAHQSASKPPPNPYAEPLYPTGAVPSNKPT